MDYIYEYNVTSSPETAEPRKLETVFPVYIPSISTNKVLNIRSTASWRVRILRNTLFPEPSICLLPWVYLLLLFSADIEWLLAWGAEVEGVSVGISVGVAVELAPRSMSILSSNTMHGDSFLAIRIHT